MSDTVPGEESHVDGIFEVASYEAPMPARAKENFLPWHRPRKQYVRHCQWCHEVTTLVNDRPPAEGTLKYLGLPGVDLLDLRYFHTAVCEPHGIKLRFLGFNMSAHPRSSAQIELNISLDEVKRLNSVDPLSAVIGDNFALVANQKSVAFRRMCEFGPYDVINLDLCDGFGAHEPGALSNSYYDAVTSLLSLQARYANPWLLFLTTRADKANINATVLQVLIDKYCTNLEQCAPFKEASKEHFAIETKDAVAEAVGDAGGLLHVFLTGLCKWFVGLALEHQPPISVEVRSVFGYRVERAAAHEDLVSIAFRFTPTFMPVSDPAGLATQAAVPLDEGTLATRALRRVAKRIDADQKLSEDVTLMQRMTDDTAHLLEQARYDPKKYRLWAAAA